MHVAFDPPLPPARAELKCFVCETPTNILIQVVTDEAEWRAASKQFSPASWCVVFGGGADARMLDGTGDAIGRALFGKDGRVFVGICEAHEEHACLINSMKVTPISFAQWLESQKGDKKDG